MQIILVRHGIALELHDLPSGSSDATRPLSDKGHKRMKEIAKGLRRILDTPLEIICSSPLRRAVETAEHLALEFGVVDLREFPELAPGNRPEQVIAALAKLPKDSCVALVGHEPDISHLAGYFLSRTDPPFLHFSKGTAALIEFTAEPTPGTGRLVWHMQPAELRKLA